MKTAILIGFEAEVDGWDCVPAVDPFDAGLIASGHRFDVVAIDLDSRGEPGVRAVAIAVANMSDPPRVVAVRSSDPGSIEKQFAAASRGE
jgi:hypothetical protein